VVFTSSPLLLDRAERVVLVHDDEVVAVGLHRVLLHGEPRYRAVVTRETEDEAALSGVPDHDEAALRGALEDDDAALRSALEEIEESA
jgi:putative ABC transport system ATP-binding protein